MSNVPRFRAWIAPLLLLPLLLAVPAAADSFREEFDQPGTDPAATRFSVLLVTGGATVARDPIGPGLGAPNTGGVLPVDEGGDSELRFYETAVPFGQGYALTPETHFAEVEIDGYVAIGLTDSFGTRSAALMVRVSETGLPINAYAVVLTHLTVGRLSLQRIRNNVGELLAVADDFPVYVANENYRFYLRASGNAITGGVVRVEEVDGERVETPIDLDLGTPGVQNELTAVDSELTSGAVGLRAFARSTNSVFFDDVTVLDVVFRDGFESGDTAAWTATAP